MIATAQKSNLFCEVVIAPEYDNEALTILQERKNRIILIQNEMALP
jgi:phosphoribosylaminoimidazolecarboxamide formyltransferase/IMP cyclohydrolase